MNRQDAYKLGHKGEGLAALYLRLKSYRILAKRYKTHVGEADLVARRGRSLVFAEVKARKTFEAGLESITAKQKKRVIKAAEYYLMENPKVADLDIRFDAILVCPGFKIKHLQDAWQT